MTSSVTRSTWGGAPAAPPPHPPTGLAGRPWDARPSSGPAGDRGGSDRRSSPTFPHGFALRQFIARAYPNRPVM
jgi:hypothetical protein